ncbi:MAG: imidazoleglycerol-phosphate dehydratase [Candidatus Pacebacteria bacterium]|nr:imidazoleglycerol-phosphate dehydratase [Candidatus Paceibacterota bacterium]
MDILVELCLDDPSDHQLSIVAKKDEVGFGLSAINLFEHLFAQIYHHGKLGGKILGEGDLPHHLIEDIGISFGQAFKESLGDRKGIRRFESISVPFEGSLAEVSVDLSGRGYACLNFQDADDKTLAGVAQHFFEGVALNGGFNLYGKIMTVGTLRNDHHKLEAFCKAFGTVLHRATRIVDASIPSTKGI